MPCLSYGGTDNGHSQVLMYPSVVLLYPQIRDITIPTCTWSSGPRQGLAICTCYSKGFTSSSVIFRSCIYLSGWGANMSPPLLQFGAMPSELLRQWLKMLEENSSVLKRCVILSSNTTGTSKFMWQVSHCLGCTKAAAKIQ